MPDLPDIPESHLRPGALWMAHRPGSRSANRIVGRSFVEPNGTRGGRGHYVYYRTHRLRTWCTYAAWCRWIASQDARFCNVDPLLVYLEETEGDERGAPSPT